MTINEELRKLYLKKSKHSNYQVLSKSLAKIIKQDDVITQTRYEQERLEFIKNNIDINDRTVLDIGGNTGYFVFELLEAGAKSAHLYEGNHDHCEFVELSGKALGIDNRLKVTNRYYDFNNTEASRYDVTLLLNVLHHIGDDYHEQRISILEAKNTIIEQLNWMSRYTEMLVFQLGYNWQGNPGKCLFQNGTKSEMIEFIKNGVLDNWDIKSIGIAEKHDGKIKYVELNKNNIERDDSMGEFLNRPLFILESRTSVK